MIWFTPRSKHVNPFRPVTITFWVSGGVNSPKRTLQSTRPENAVAFLFNGEWTSCKDLRMRSWHLNGLRTRLVTVLEIYGRETGLRDGGFGSLGLRYEGISIRCMVTRCRQPVVGFHCKKFKIKEKKQVIQAILLQVSSLSCIVFRAWKNLHYFTIVYLKHDAN